jgi:hypothetical protein
VEDVLLIRNISGCLNCFEEAGIKGTRIPMVRQPGRNMMKDVLLIQNFSYWFKPWRKYGAIGRM